jgi:hypothetical protein
MEGPSASEEDDSAAVESVKELPLPPMLPFAELAKSQRVSDSRAFRQYLVDSGVVKCFVKLYQHVVKNELRLDNPKVVKDFFLSYQESDDPKAQECSRVIRENAGLRARNARLEEQVAELMHDIGKQQRLRTSSLLWRALVSAAFWKNNGALACAGGRRPDRAEALTLQQLFSRLCGCTMDTKTGCVLVELLRPVQLAHAKTISKDDFLFWAARDMPDTIQAWVEDVLLPKMHSEELQDAAPFEEELLQEIRESGMYPNKLNKVSTVVVLDLSLVSFLEAIAQGFASP